MTESLKWKSKLQSSGLPLEYQAARILDAHGFTVLADYTYSRVDAGMSKDFSVDIQATHLVSHRGNPWASALELLVECKHRHRNVKWLFLPDPNSDFSIFTSSATLYPVDKFSWTFFPSDCTAEFEDTSPLCLKGVEIDTNGGNAHESEIRHGLLQLQYAVPHLLTRHILVNAPSPRDGNAPLFMCSVLLTTAELWVAHERFSSGEVENAARFEDIATPADWVIVRIEPGPDFRNHSKAACSELRALGREPAVVKLEEHRRKRGESDFALPSAICEGLANGRTSYPDCFSQVIVCSLAAFPKLVSSLKSCATRVTRSSRKKRSDTSSRPT